jgi:voltage-gated sodium channel
MPSTLRTVVSSARFQLGVTLAILVAAVLVGLETYPHIVARYGTLLHALDIAVLTVFVVEIVLKLAAEGAQPWRYFRDPWNVFDFLIVGVAFLPLGQYVTVLRLARLLRVLRLVRALPRLQILVHALLKSIPSMGYVSLLLLLVFYVYGVGAVFLFGKNDPFRFGTLHVALITLFQVATAEDWSTTLYTQMYGCNQRGYDGHEALCTAPAAFPVIAPMFFVSFILLGTMIILNLFIGVIMNSMAEAQREAEERDNRERLDRVDAVDRATALDAEFASLQARLADAQEAVRRLALRTAYEQGRPSTTPDAPRSAAS